MIPLVGLPSGYSENRLILMAQGPRVLYAYWELSPGQIIALAEKSQLKLRLNKVGTGSYRICDAEPLANHYYFDGVDPGVLYSCDLSTVHNNGDFYPFITSNTVMAPQEKPDEDVNLSSADLFCP